MIRMHHMLEVSAGLAIVALLLLVASSATAQTANTARLDYRRLDSAKSCPDEQAIRDGVAARLGYDPFVAESSREVRVTIRPVQPQGFAATIELSSSEQAAPSRRDLNSSATDCDDLVETLIFTVSVAIDPSSTARIRTSGEPARAQKAVMAAVLRVHDAQSTSRAAAAGTANRMAESKNSEETATDTPKPEPREPLELRAAVGGGLAVGMAPRATALFRFELGVGRENWSVGLGGSGTLPVRTEVKTGQLETSMLLGELTPCWRLGWAQACGLVVAGALRTTGVDLSDTASNAHFYGAIGPRLGAEFRLAKQVSLRFSAQVLATVARTRVLVDEDMVWRTPDFSGGLDAAFVFNLL